MGGFLLKEFNASDYLLEVSKGNVPGHRTFQRSSQNDNVGTTFQDITPQGGLQTLPTSAETLEIVSTSTDDTNGGSGANSVIVPTLNENYERQQQIVILDGTTPVTLTGTHLRTEPINIVTQGSAMNNIGDIILRPSGGGETRQIMPAGIGESSSSHYTSPAGLTIRALSVNVFAPKGSDVQFRSVVTPEGGATIIGGNRPAYQSDTQMSLPSLPVAPPKTDVNFQAISTNEGTSVSMMIEYLEIAEDLAGPIPRLGSWL